MSQHGANHGEHWSNIHLNNLIIAQVLATGWNCRYMDMPVWVEEMLDWWTKSKVRMVSGECAFQAAGLFYMDNHQSITQHAQKFEDLVESMGELREVKETLRRQEQRIMSLTNCVKVLERRRREASGSSSSQGMGSSIYGTAWTSSGTRCSPVTKRPVQINFLEPVDNSEGEREVHVAENVNPVPVRAPTPSSPY